MDGAGVGAGAAAGGAAATSTGSGFGSVAVGSTDFTLVAGAGATRGVAWRAGAAARSGAFARGDSPSSIADTTSVGLNCDDASAEVGAAALSRSLRSVGSIARSLDCSDRLQARARAARGTIANILNALIATSLVERTCCRFPSIDTGAFIYTPSKANGIYAARQ